MTANGQKAFLYGAIVALVGLICFAGYKIYENVNLLKHAVIKLVNVKFSAVSSEQWVLTFILSFENKSAIDIEVTGYKFDGMVNDVQVAKIVNTTSQYIAANATSNLNVVMSFNPKLIWKNFVNENFLKTLLGNYKEMSAGIKGTISAKHQGISVTDIPLDYKVKLGDYI